jgi:hypothetical protein
MYLNYDNTRDYSIIVDDSVWSSESLNNPNNIFVCWKHKHVMVVSKSFVPLAECEGKIIEIRPHVKKASSVSKVRIKAAIMKIAMALEED